MMENDSKGDSEIRSLLSSNNEESPTPSPRPSILISRADSVEDGASPDRRGLLSEAEGSKSIRDSKGSPNYEELGGSPNRRYSVREVERSPGRRDYVLELEGSPSNQELEGSPSNPELEGSPINEELEESPSSPELEESRGKVYLVRELERTPDRRDFVLEPEGIPSTYFQERDGSPSRRYLEVSGSPERCGLVRDVGDLTEEGHEKFRELLDSVAAESMERIDLRTGFYTEARPCSSWHNVNQSDVLDHHRVDVFPRFRHRLSTYDADHRRHHHKRKHQSPNFEGREGARKSDVGLKTSKSTSNTTPRAVLSTAAAAIGIGRPRAFSIIPTSSCSPEITVSHADFHSESQDLGVTGSRDFTWAPRNRNVETPERRDLPSGSLDLGTSENLDLPSRPQNISSGSRDFNSESRNLGISEIREFASGPRKFETSERRASSAEPAPVFNMASFCLPDVQEGVPLEGSGTENGMEKFSVEKDAPGPGLRKAAEGELSSCKVDFILGADDIECEADAPSKTKRNKSPRHSRVSRKPSRCRLGDQVHLDTGMHRVPTEPDEAECLEDVHLDDMASHRFTDSRPHRHRKTRRRGETSARSPTRVIFMPEDKEIDASHKMFVELDELRCCEGSEGSEWVWQERARWIKFEEDIMEGAERWGQPHVSSLSFHSLLELRSCLEKGVVLLDLDATDIESVGKKIVDELSDSLSAQDQERILKVLLLKHRHHDEDHKMFLRRNRSQSNLISFAQSITGATPPQRIQPSSVSLDIPLDCHMVKINGDKGTEKSGLARSVDELGESSRPLLTQTSLNETKNNGSVVLFKDTNRNGNMNSIKSKSAEVVIEESGNLKAGGMLSLSPLPYHQPRTQSENLLEALNHMELAIPQPPPSTKQVASSQILKRIPPGAEATNVLVGCVDFVCKPVMAFVRLRRACPITDLLEVPLPVKFVIVLIGPPIPGMDYYEMGRSISTLMSDQSFHDRAYQFQSKQDLLKAIHAFLDDSIVLPPGNLEKKTLLPIMDMARKKQQRKQQIKREKEKPPAEKKTDDPLRRTGRFFGGVIRDIKKRYPMYLSDFRDGLNLQCLATFFFVYFACLSPAITFGGLLGEKTDKWMGVSEMLVATSVCGIIFALTSAQPLVIIGATGPVLVFEEAVYKVCKMFDIEYLSFRCWMCAWILVIIVLVVMLEGSFLVRYITRFTEEVFACLISLIFIFEVFNKLIKIFIRYPLKVFYPPPTALAYCSSNYTTDIYDNLDNFNVTFSSLLLPNQTSGNLQGDGISLNPLWLTPNMSEAECVERAMDGYLYPNTALFSVLLTFATFLIALLLKKLRNSQFLGRSARRAIGDFGVPIAIIVMVCVDVLAQPYTEKLFVPDGLKPTDSTKRGWLINPFGDKKFLPYWSWFLAAVPALLLFILLFMEVQITSMIVNKKDRKLKKGSGYHFDLLLVGLLVMFSGCLGLPVMCSATVRSVTHVSALTVYSSTHAPGEKPVLEHVKEQRVTALLVHIMIGVSLAMGPVLRLVPLVVLFGIFLYMGIASMSGMQFLNRVKLLFIPVKHHPNVGYVKRVRRLKMNLYTMIQLLCLAVLWVVKATIAAVAFPFVLVLLIPFRIHIIKFFFTHKELSELDREEDHASEDDEEVEPDFYTQAHMPM